MRVGSSKTFHQSPSGKGLACTSRIVGLDPFGGHRCRRLAVFRADFEAVLQPLVRAGGDASGVQPRKKPARRAKVAPACGSSGVKVSNSPNHSLPSSAWPLPFDRTMPPA